MSQGARSERVPLVSIVIPARNEAAHLPRVLAAIERLDYPAERREVIVVDNGSTDETAAVARRGGARLLAAPSGNVGEVRNVGARAAQGEVLAFLDADCLVGPRWLTTAVSALRDEPIGAVGGNCTVGEEGNWVQRAWVVEQPARTEETERLATASFIVRRQTFVELGGFDGTLGAGEDDDLSRRIRGAGYRLQRAAECSVVHLGYPSTLRGVMRRQLWHGRSQLHGGFFDPMVILSHLFGTALFVLVPLGLFSGAWRSAAEGLAATLLLAGIPAWRKQRRAGGAVDRQLVARIIVYWWFMLGRSCGLVLNYGDRVARLWQVTRAERES